MDLIAPRLYSILLACLISGNFLASANASEGDPAVSGGVESAVPHQGKRIDSMRHVPGEEHIDDSGRRHRVISTESESRPKRHHRRRDTLMPHPYVDIYVDGDKKRYREKTKRGPRDASTIEHSSDTESSNTKGKRKPPHHRPRQ